MNNGSKLIVVDVDDVLVHIATPWVIRAVQRVPQIAMVAPHLAEWLRTAPSQVIHDTVIARPQPHIQQWMVQEHGVPEELIPKIDLVYRADPEFYDELVPTTFCAGLIAALSLPGRVNHIHAVTHNYANSDPCVESKDRWLRNMLGGPERLTIHHIEAGQKKSEVIREHCPEPDSFADDAMKNVIDVLLNDDVRPHEILIPRMGHNQLLPEVQQLAFLRKININYYDNVL